MNAIPLEHNGRAKVAKYSLFASADTALYSVLLIWVVFIVNSAAPILRLSDYGIRPHERIGLLGILLCPLLHANISHIVANTAPLFILLTLSLSFSKGLTVVTLLITTLLGGGFVWLCGMPETNHIGASGLIFGLTGFLMAIGPFRQEWKAFIISIIVIILYKGSLMALLSDNPGISWTSHAGGFIAGILAAWWTRNLSTTNLSKRKDIRIKQ